MKATRWEVENPSIPFPFETKRRRNPDPKLGTWSLSATAFHLVSGEWAEAL